MGCCCSELHLLETQVSSQTSPFQQDKTCSPPEAHRQTHTTKVLWLNPAWVDNPQIKGLCKLMQAKKWRPVHTRSVSGKLCFHPSSARELISSSKHMSRKRLQNTHPFEIVQRRKCAPANLTCLQSTARGAKLKKPRHNGHHYGMLDLYILVENLI